METFRWKIWPRVFLWNSNTLPNFNWNDSRDISSSSSLYDPLIYFYVLGCFSPTECHSSLKRFLAGIHLAIAKGHEQVAYVWLALLSPFWARDENTLCWNRCTFNRSFLIECNDGVASETIYVHTHTLVISFSRPVISITHYENISFFFRSKWVYQANELACSIWLNEWTSFTDRIIPYQAESRENSNQKACKLYLYENNSYIERHAQKMIYLCKWLDSLVFHFLRSFLTSFSYTLLMLYLCVCD